MYLKWNQRCDIDNDLHFCDNHCNKTVKHWLGFVSREYTFILLQWTLDTCTCVAVR